VIVPAILGWRAIMKGDKEAHRIWMIRFGGSLMGAFWVARIMYLVGDPLFR